MSHVCSPCPSGRGQRLTERPGRADIILSASHPIVWCSSLLPRSPKDTETLIGSACHLLFSIFSPLQSLETVPYRRSCHFYCPCRLSHRPRTTGSVALLWWCWLSLKDRDLEPADKVACVTTSKATSHAFASQYF